MKSYRIFFRPINIKTFNMSTFTTNPALCVVYKSSDWLLATLSFCTYQLNF